MKNIDTNAFIFKSLFGFNIWILTVCTATIFTGLGIWAILKISDKILDRNNRFYTVFFLFTSYSIISMCGWQLRPYGLLFCLSSWMLYFYLEKLENNNKSANIGYVVFMILTMYTHWYGVLISLVYAFIDLILFLKKRINGKFILSYIIVGLLFLPCFIAILYLHKGDIGSYGVEVPSVVNIVAILRFISGMLFLNMFILISIICMIFLNNLGDSKNRILKIISSVAILLVVLTFVYSRYINSNGSIFRARYFSVLLPHAIILLSFGALKLIEYLKSKKFAKELCRMMLVFYIVTEVVMTYMFVFCFPNFEGKSSYKRWAEYLKKQEDVYADNTLIICTYGKTWIDLYFEELPANIIGVNPLNLPNKKHMAKENISDFRYFVKNGKKTNEKVSLEEVEKYDTVYYLEEYRTISDEFESLFDDYEIGYNESACLYKLEKINER